MWKLKKKLEKTRKKTGQICYIVSLWDKNEMKHRRKSVETMDKIELSLKKISYSILAIITFNVYL